MRAIGFFLIDDFKTSFYVAQLATTGIEAYLWLRGGKVWSISNDLERVFLAKGTRWEAKASHKMNKNNITDTIEIIDPTLATTFQHKYASG